MPETLTGKADRWLTPMLRGTDLEGVDSDRSILTTKTLLEFLVCPFKTNCFGHGGKVCRVLGKFLSLKEFIFDRVASRVTFILRLPDSALQKSDQKLEICSEEESEDLSSQMLSSSFLVIHDSAGGGHDDVTEN